MALPQLQPALFIKGNNANQNAALSAVEAQVRGILSSDLETVFTRATVTPAQVINLNGYGLAIFRQSVRVVWGKTWGQFTGTKRQSPNAFETDSKINKFLAIDFSVPELDIERFMQSPNNIAAQLVAKWVDSFMRNLQHNFELIFLQGTTDYAIAKSLVIPIDLEKITPDEACNAYYQIWDKNIKLKSLVDDITVGTNQKDLVCALSMKASQGLSKAFVRLNYGQIAADAVTTGRRYRNEIAGMESYETLYLGKDFITETPTQMHLENSYYLGKVHGWVSNIYMWGMQISFTKVRQTVDISTQDLRIIGKAMYGLPVAVRPNLMYIIMSKMPTHDEIQAAIKKDLRTNPDNENCSYQSCSYDNITMSGLSDIIYFDNLGTITMANSIPTIDELEKAILSAGNFGYKAGEVEFSEVTDCCAIVTANKDSKIYYGSVKLTFTKPTKNIQNEKPNNFEVSQLLVNELSSMLNRQSTIVEKQTKAITELLSDIKNKKNLSNSSE